MSDVPYNFDDVKTAVKISRENGGGWTGPLITQNYILATTPNIDYTLSAEGMENQEMYGRSLEDVLLYCTYILGFNAGMEVEKEKSAPLTRINEILIQNYRNEVNGYLKKIDDLEKRLAKYENKG